MNPRQPIGGVPPRVAPAGAAAGHPRPAPPDAAAPLALSAFPADTTSRRLALAVCALSLLGFLAAVPFAKTPLPAAHWFIPLNQSVLIVNDLVTATLLFGQLRLTRSPALLVLACAYVFAALMAVAHLLSFPGVFAAGGLLGGGGQSTAYLFIFWHTGFPLLVAAYALLENRAAVLRMTVAAAACRALPVVGVAAAGLVALATAGEYLLPPVMDGNRYSSGFNLARYGQWAVTALAAWVLWRRRSRSVLDTWLLVVLGVCFFEIGLVAVFNGGRYDLGFYAGRIYALLASSFVLLVLLTEQGKLYRDLVLARETARSESALRESRQVLKLAMEGGRMGVWSRDIVRGTAWWSPELEQIVGLPAGGLGSTVDGFTARIHPEDLAPVGAAVRAAAAGPDGFAVEFRLRHADGTWRWVDGRGRAVRGASGRPSSLFGIVIDITARKRADESAEQLEARFRTLADGMPQLAWMARPDGWIHWYNSRWYQYTGTTPQEMEGWGWQRVHDAAVLPAVLAQWQRSIDSGEPFEMVFPLRSAGGEFRPFLTQVSPLKDADGHVQHWFGTNTDITTQRAAEEALRLADRRKDEFLATLAHELRNPLAPIRMGVELLNRTAPLPATAERARDIIDRQSRHLARLVDDLLDVARITEGKVHLRRQPVSLVACVKDALNAVEGLVAQAGHRLELDITDDPLHVNADATRITQCFINLLTNAVKFTPPQGRIAVTAQRGDGSAARVCVADDGIGIDAEHIETVFEMFAQVVPALQRNQGGLGVGLALVRGFVELHGGTVAARSAGAGRGTEFVVVLPLHEEAAVAEPPTPAGVGGSGGGRRRVLVVDDNRDAAGSLTALLQMLGHEVREAHDGDAGLQIAASFDPEVVLLDVGMPGMSGLELALRIRSLAGGNGGNGANGANSGRLRLIAVTGWGQTQDRQRTLDAGFDFHLTKPVDTAELARLVSGQ